MIENSANGHQNCHQAPTTSSVRSKILMAILIRWFRYQSYFGFMASGLMWILLCSFVIISSRQMQTNESNAFNLVEDDLEEAAKSLEVKSDEPDFHFMSGNTFWNEQSRKIKKYVVVDKAHKDRPITYAEFLENMETNDDFLEDFIDVLKRGLQSFSDMDMSPYFFETPSVTSDTLNETDFEFVLVAAREFIHSSPQPQAFQKHTKKCLDRVVSFPNLGNDALLIVPCNEVPDSPNIYMHVANFVRMAPEDQIKIFWREVVNQMSRRLKAKKGKRLWLSTCGLGIFYLHVRLDNSPKYYSYLPYRNG